ncbi:MFS transporter [Patescibacteria group bacterium]|nr:MFS transporter [Patescibacteria group bacterium]
MDEEQFKQLKQPGFGYFNFKKISPVVRFLTMCDIMIISGFGLITPIFAVFITENIKNANLETVGIASTIFLLSKGLLQIPIGTIIDKIRGEIDDYWFLLLGSIGYAAIPLLYMIINTPGQLYFVQFVFGLAGAFAYPSFMAIFTRHVDKEHEGIEWSIYSTMVEIGMALTATIGAFVAYQFGFKYLFVVASITILIGNLFILGIYRKIRR